MLSSLAVSHVHTSLPRLDAPWCPGCSARLDWAIVLVDALKAR